MRIYSSFRSIPLSLKDVLLNKHLSVKQTSENFLGVDKQPDNTCPIIDKAIEEIGAVCDSLYFHKRDVKAYGSYPRECEECQSNCKETYTSNLRNLEILSDEMSDSAKIYNDMINSLEVLRNNCSELRNYILDIKDHMWKLVEKKELSEDNLDQIKKSIPEDIDLNYFFKNHDKMQLTYPSFESTSCDENCLNNRLNNELESCFESIHIELPLSSFIEKAFDNYDKIISWADQVEKAILGKMEEFNELELSEEQFTIYQALYNKENYAKLEKLKHTNIELVEDDVINFSINSEDYITPKKLEDMVKRVNALGQELNEAGSLEDFDEIEKRCIKIISELKEINEALAKTYTKYSGGDLLKYAKMAKPLAVTIKNLITCIENNAPQTFKIER